jgi:hypothetical protein
MRYKSSPFSSVRPFQDDAAALFLCAINVFKADKPKFNCAFLAKNFLFHEKAFPLAKNLLHPGKRHTSSLLDLKMAKCGRDQDETKNSASNNQGQNSAKTQNSGASQSGTSGSDQRGPLSAFRRPPSNRNNDGDDGDDPSHPISSSSSHEANVVPPHRQLQNYPTPLLRSVFERIPQHISSSVHFIPSFSSVSPSVSSPFVGAPPPSNTLPPLTLDFVLTMRRFHKLMEWAQTLDTMPYELQNSIWRYCPQTPHFSTFTATIRQWASDPVLHMEHCNALYNAILFVYDQISKEESQLQSAVPRERPHVPWPGSLQVPTVSASPQPLPSGTPSNNSSFRKRKLESEGGPSAHIGELTPPSSDLTTRPPPSPMLSETSGRILTPAVPTASTTTTTASSTVTTTKTTTTAIRTTEENDANRPQKRQKTMSPPRQM